MGSNKKQGGMKEEKTRGKQTEPQLIQCVSLAHTQVKGCFQNCLLWSRTSTAFLFLPQNDRELPRRISSTLKALLGPTKNTKKNQMPTKKQPRIWHFNTACATDALNSSTVCPHQLQRSRLKGEMQLQMCFADQYSKHRRASRGLSAHTRLFVWKINQKKKKRNRRPTKKTQNKAAKGCFPSSPNNLQSLLPLQS